MKKILILLFLVTAFITLGGRSVYANGFRTVDLATYDGTNVHIVMTGSGDSCPDGNDYKIYVDADDDSTMLATITGVTSTNCTVDYTGPGFTPADNTTQYYLSFANSDGSILFEALGSHIAFTFNIPTMGATELIQQQTALMASGQANLIAGFTEASKDNFLMVLLVCGGLIVAIIPVWFIIRKMSSLSREQI